MGFFNFLLLRLAGCFAMGIVLGYYHPAMSHSKALPFMLFSLFALWWVNRKRTVPGIFFGLLSYLLFLSLGYHYTLELLPQNNPKHFCHLTTGQPSLMQVRIQTELRPGKNHNRYLGKVELIGQRPTSGRILVHIPQGEGGFDAGTDDLLLFAGTPLWLQGPANPDEFDYAAYMRTQQVYHQVFAQDNSLSCFNPNSYTPKGMALRLRDHLEAQLERSALSREAKALMQALVLGNRHSLDRKRYHQYADAGAVHMLAVSGLHVGIVFMIAQFFLKPLYFFKYGLQARFVLLTGLLWGYAYLTGLSPSVSRAVSMFSCFALAGLINRPTNSINNLCLSFFILLVHNPLLLFQVGFQLSYTAVFFIFWLQPAIARFYQPHFFVDKLAWNILTVSIAAQLGVTPFTIYYFHQFPGLFLLSNITLLPLLGVMVGTGLFLLFLLFVEVRMPFLEWAYGELLELANLWIAWISAREEFIIRGIYPDQIQVALAFLLLIAVGLWLKTPSLKYLRAILLGLLLLNGYALAKSSWSDPGELVVFHRTRISLLGYRKGNAMLLLKRDSTIYKDEYPIKEYRLANSMKGYSEEKLGNYLRIGDWEMVVVDSSGVYPNVPHADVLLVENAPINLERLIDSISPRRIIADGSNYRWLVEHWRSTTKKRKLRFHHTGSSGAFVLGQ